jgi:hypothetical protein
VTFQPNEPSLNAIVLLWSQSTQQAILIGVGVMEGLAIVDGLLATQNDLPSTHQFLANLLHGTSAPRWGRSWGEDTPTGTVIQNKPDNCPNSSQSVA